MKVVVFSKSDCPYCQKAKAWLDMQFIDYAVETLDDFAARQALYDRLGLVEMQRTVPQILVTHDDGSVEHIRGYTALIESGLEKRWTIDIEDFLRGAA